MHASIQPGLTGFAEVVVAQEHTAAALGSGAVPVFGTPALIALLEQAAVNALAPYLEPGQTSVGVHVAIDHLAATPLGMAVRGRATLLSVEGRRMLFALSADDAVELVATGRHERVVVDEARFLARANEKAGKAST